MRKASKDFDAPKMSRVQGYHESESWGESYAYSGFGKRLYFTSDRTKELNEDFTRKDGKSTKGFGLEIETVCNGINSDTAYAETLEKLIFPLSGFPEHLFKLQRDGSLEGRSSAECITQIMTKEFIRNNYAAFKKFYDYYLPAFNATAGAECCGMHCNISLGALGTTPDAQDEAIRKLFYIVNKHYRFMCQMVKRLGATGYCAKMDYTHAKTMDLTAFSSDHYVCFNLGHYRSGRIELRLVGGQKTFANFRNTMETIFFLVDRVKKITWAECDDLTRIFKGCNGYVLDRIRDALVAQTINGDDFNKISENSTRERNYI